MTETSAEPSGSTPRAGSLVLIAAATAVGAAVRLVGLDAAPLWLDESATFVALERLWDDDRRAPAFVQASNPLYYGLLWIWTRMLGDGAAALRGLSAAASIATIPVAAFAARRLGGPGAAAFAAWLVALHPLAVHYGREARAYALWSLLLLVALAALTRAAARDGAPGDGRRWALAALAWLAAFGAHVFTLFGLPAAVATVALAADRRAAARHWLAFAAAVGTATGLYCALVLAPSLSAGTGAWLATSDWSPWRALLDSAWSLLPSGAYPGHLAALSLASAGVAPWAPRPIAWVAAALPIPLTVWILTGALRSRTGRLLAALAAGSLLTLWSFSWLRPAFLAGRYDLVAWPALVLCLAVGLAERRREASGRAALAAAVVLALCAAVPIGRELSYRGGDRFDERRALRLAELASGGDLVIVFSNDDDAMAHTLHRAGFEGRLRPFPGWLDEQIAFLDSRRDLSRERTRALARDASALQREIRDAHGAGRRVLWLGDRLRLDGRGARAVLPARLWSVLAASGYVRTPLDAGLAIELVTPDPRRTNQPSGKSASPAK